VAEVGTSKAGGTLSQQAVVHPSLAADAHGNKQSQDEDTMEKGLKRCVLSIKI
jgi:hypothetical protein